MTTTVSGLAELAALTGRDLGASDWLSIEQDRVDRFADATGDHQWIHVDPERAKTGPFGTTIAHGYLTLSLVIPLWTKLLTIEGIGMAVNYGLNKVRFPAPVPVGSRIRLAARVAEARAVAGDGVEIDGGAKPAAVAQAVYRYYA